MIYQAVYICETCQEQGLMAENACCCAGCAETCHEGQGHEVSFLAFGRGYCDCGQSSSCRLCYSSKCHTEHILSNSMAIAQDLEARIQGTEESGLLIPPFTAHKLVDSPDSYIDRLEAASIAFVQESKETYWIGSQEQAINIFEEYALAIFRYHVHQLSSSSYNPYISGAEWWIQVKHDVVGVETMSTSAAVGIDLHFDKDEEIGSLFSVGIFPQISTVTYLSSRQPDIPTLIIQDTVKDEVGSPLSIAYLSAPVSGKHIAFDGRYLHGAPIGIAPYLASYPPRSQPRVTFLVNIWLNHKPANLTRMLLPSSLNPLFSQCLHEIRLQPTPDKIANLTIKPSSIREDDRDGRWMRIPFVSDQSVWGKDENETGIYLKLWLPNQFLQPAYQQGLDLATTSSWILPYNHPKAKASLEYETDEEFMEEMTLRDDS
jgi:hypothetical protein